MNDDRDKDRALASQFLRTVETKDVALEDKVEVLRGVCCFLLQQLQKTYMYITRHTNGYDSMMVQELSEIYRQTDEMMTMFFPDYLEPADEGEEEDDDDDAD